MLTARYEERADKDFSYEEIFLGYLERLVRDLDRKVDRGKERLRRSAQAKQQVSLSHHGVHMLCLSGSLYWVMDQEVALVIN